MRLQAHRYTDSLDLLAGMIGLVLPPLRRLGEVFVKGLHFCLRKLEVLESFLAGGFRKARWLIIFQLSVDAHL